MLATLFKKRVKWGDDIFQTTNLPKYVQQATRSRAHFKVAIPRDDNVLSGRHRYQGVRNNCNPDGCDSSKLVGVPWCRRVRGDISSTEEDERKHFLVSFSLQTYKIRICYTECVLSIHKHIQKIHHSFLEKKNKNRYTVCYL